MTAMQAVSFTIVGGMLVLFVTDRFRYDVVAMLALAAGLLSGMVKPNEAFVGFGEEVVIIIAAALVLSRAVSNAGIVERVLHPWQETMRTPTRQVAVLSTLVATMSVMMKNVGALAIAMPAALQSARRHNTSPSRVLMPLSFASLLGGTVTLIGTSPNVLISSVRRELTGHPYQMFDFAPVGAGLTVLGLALLVVCYRLLPERRPPGAGAEETFRVEDYTAELRFAEDSPLIGKTVGELEALADGEARVAAILRETNRRYIPAAHWVMFPDDTLVIEADPQPLQRLVEAAKLTLVGAQGIGAEASDVEHVGATEAVITADSRLVGRTPQELRLRDRFGVNLLAISRRGKQSVSRLATARFRVGDLLVLQGELEAMPAVLVELGCLPLAERNLLLGRPRQAVLPLLLVGGAMAASALRLLPAAEAFFIAAVLAVVLGAVTLREAYEAVEWPVLILIGCLIPIGLAFRDTGAAGLVGGWIAAVAYHLPAWGAVGLILIVSMLVTPLLHHAAAVLVMGPVAAGVAAKLGLAVDPFLMAVAVGASSDFLTPIGHQCNTLVLGPGGYRFRDYWRLGLPLSVLVVVAGTALICLVWPLHG